MQKNTANIGVLIVARNVSIYLLLNIFRAIISPYTYTTRAIATTIIDSVARGIALSLSVMKLNRYFPLLKVYVVNLERENESDDADHKAKIIISKLVIVADDAVKSPTNVDPI